MSITEKYISWILKGGLLATPFLVFVVTRSLYFPFITGKNFAFRILIEILAVVWVFAALRFPSFRPRPTPLLWAVIAFVGVLGLATVFSISPYRSFWSNFERMEGYIAILHLFLYFLVLSSVFRTNTDWRLFFHTSIGASVLVALYGIAQIAGRFEIHQGGTRVDATFGNATYLAAYLVFHLFFLIWFFLRERERWLKIVYAAAFLLEIFILYHTATRGAILGFLGGLAVLGALVALTSSGRVRRFSLASLGVVAALPIVFFLIRDTDAIRGNPVLARFATISPQETTTQARFTIWSMALRGVLERPVLGWGQENFLYVFSKQYEPSLWRQEPWFDRAHNVFLDWLTAGGVSGLAAYLALYGIAAWLLFRAFRRGSIDGPTFTTVVALFTAHFFQNLFVFDNLTSYLLFFALLAYVQRVAVADIAPSRRRPFSIPAPMQAATALLAGALAVLLLWFANVQPLRAAGNILNALRIAQVNPPAGKVDALIAEFSHGISLGTFGTMELREQLSQTATALSRDQSLALQDKAKLLEYAAGELESQRRTFPYDMRAKAFLSSLYVISGRPAEAIGVLNEAFAISDKRQQFYFIAAEAYLNAGDRDRAIAALRKAHELAPDYPEATANLAIVLILSGRDKEAGDFLEANFGKRFVAEERYAQAYINIGRFDLAAKTWELLVEAAPDDFRWRASLGVSYARSGRPNEGIAELARAAELEPQFKPQADQIIEQIRSGALR